MIGFNWANSVDNVTIEKGATIRSALDLEENVRFEHHITETQKSIVIQPYDRTAELVELADRVAVMFSGRIVDIVDPENVRVEDIGMMMAGSTEPVKDGAQ